MLQGVTGDDERSFKQQVDCGEPKQEDMSN